MEELMIRDNTRKGYRIGKEGDGVVTDQPRARGTVQDQICPTVLTQQGGGCGVIVKTEIKESREMTEDRLKALIENPMPEEEVQRLIAAQKLTVRKLTPKECWRLMGMADEDYFKAAEVCSEYQLYKQAGNSIVVDVLEAIFDTMLTETKTIQQTKLCDW